MNRLNGTVLVAVALISFAAAGDVAIESLGTHLYGPQLTMEDLKGRVVLIEKWGVN